MYPPICTFVLESLVSIPLPVQILVQVQILVLVQILVQILVQVSTPPLVIETGDHNPITSLEC